MLEEDELDEDSPQWGDCDLITTSRSSVDDNATPTEISLPVQDCGPKILYSFFRNSDYFKVSDLESILQLFEYSHQLFLRTLNKFIDDQLIPPSYFMKSYMKFRHNCFCTICCLILKLKIKIMSTDVPLSQWIESQKTPDYVWVDEDSKTMSIFEFTVSVSTETIMYTKGGGIFKRKYQEEVDLLKEKGYNTGLYIIGLSLEDEDISQLVCDLNSSCRDEITAYEKSILTKFKIFCKRELNKINSFVSSSMSGNLKLPKHLKETSELLKQQLNQGFKRPRLPQVLFMSKEIIATLNSYRPLLLSRTKDMQDGKYVLIYTNYKFYFKRDETGATLGEIKNHLIDFDVGKLLLNTKRLRDGEIEDLEGNLGDLMITCQTKEYNKPKSKEVKLPNTILRIGYFNTDCSATLYGDPSIYNSKDEIKNVEDNTLFDSNYLNKLVDSLNHEKLYDNDTNNAFLSKNEVNLTQTLKIHEVFKRKLEIVNDINHDKSSKATFILPMVTIPLASRNYSEHDTLFYRNLSKFRCLGPYTSLVLDKAGKSLFSSIMAKNQNEEIQKARKIYNELSSTFYKKLTSKPDYILKNIPNKRYIELYYPEMMFELRELTKSASNYKALIKEHSIKEKIGIVKTSGKDNKDLFKMEMLHFDRNKKVEFFKGIGNINESIYTETDESIKSFLNMLLEPILPSFDLHMFFQEESLDNIVLSLLKNESKRKWNEFSSEYSKTPLSRACEFCKRFSTTLFKASLMSLNNNYVFLDNLGLENTLLLVKGGSKLFKTQKSKLFRLIFPYNDNYRTMYGFRDNTDYKIFTYNGMSFVCTPWSLMNLEVMKSGQTIDKRVFQVLYSMKERLNLDSITKLPKSSLLPILLAFHQRRKTEIFMHNMRYVIVNNLAEFANIKGVIESFATFNYTYLDMWLKKSLELRYVEFATKLQNCRYLKNDKEFIASGIIDPFFGEVIESIEQLTYIIYSTYLMTKAPITKSIEQSNNFRPILEDVVDYEKEHKFCKYLDDKTMRFSLEENVKPSNDFAYDPKHCQFLGNRIACVIKDKGGLTQTCDAWYKILNSNIDSIANSHGLRGFKKENFFNSKGYEIFYKFVEENIIKKMGMDLNPEDYATETNLKRLNQMVIEDRITFNDVMELIDIKELLFHVVDKIQRGGGREIMVMDVKTKIFQQPIEKMFKKICELVPNELISRPSKYRPGHIHKMYFESALKNTLPYSYNLVLDCRRWAPHSVLQKYVHFLHGMKSMLPSSFYELCLGFLGMMMEDKYFITRDYVYSKIENNKKISGLENLFKSDDAKDSWRLKLRFSFVMGIFNYLSSLMHSASQIVATEVILLYNLKHDKGVSILSMLAHSDDSGGKLFLENKESVHSVITLYDQLMLGANHMISVKKSGIFPNNNYFELLSILYMFGSMVPLLVKFLGSLSFTATGKGYCVDITIAFSKCIEIITNGGTFDEAYLCLKIMESYICNIYGIKPTYNLPYTMLGGIDPHPLSLLIGGSDSEIMRNLKYNRRGFLNAYYVAVKTMLIKEGDTTDLSLKFDMGMHVPAQLKGLLESPKFLSESWLMKNTKMGNTKLNYYWFVNMLRDPTFISSVTSEPESRSFAKIFSAFKTKTIIGLDGTRRLASEVRDILYTASNVGGDFECEEGLRLERFYTFISQELIEFWDSLDDINIDFCEKAPMSIKPITIQNTPLIPKTSLVSSSILTAFVYERDLLPYLALTKDPTNRCKKMLSIIESFGARHNSPNELYKVANYLQGLQSSTFCMISSVSSDLKRISDNVDKLKFLSYNSYVSKSFLINIEHAKHIDNERSLKQLNVPSKVTEFCELLWFKNFLKNEGLDSIDILNCNLNNLINDTKINMDPKWARVMEYAGREKLNLSNLDFWCHWVKEQQRINDYWVGIGALVITVPETAILLDYDEKNVRSISLNKPFIGYFDNISSWYLNLILVNDIQVNMKFLMPINLSKNDCYFGYNSENGLWGIDTYDTFTNILCIARTDFFEDLSWTSEECDHDTLGSVTRLKTQTGIKSVYFLNTRTSQRATTMPKLIDPNKIIANYKDPRVHKLISRTASSFGIYITKNIHDLIMNVTSSTIYNILFINNKDKLEIDDEKDYFNLLRFYKTQYPNFSFPNDIELLSIHKDLNNYMLPSKAYDFIKKLGVSAMNQSDLKNLQNLIKRACRDGNIDSIFDSLTKTYGYEASIETLVLASVKNKDMLLGSFGLGFNGPTCIIFSNLNHLFKKALNDKILGSSRLNQLYESMSDHVKKYRLTKSDLFYDLSYKVFLELNMIGSWNYSSTQLIREYIYIVSQLLNSEGFEFIEYQDDYDTLIPIDFDGSSFEEKIGFVSDLMTDIGLYGDSTPNNVMLKQDYTHRKGRISLGFNNSGLKSRIKIKISATIHCDIFVENRRVRLTDFSERGPCTMPLNSFKIWDPNDCLDCLLMGEDIEEDEEGHEMNEDDDGWGKASCIGTFSQLQMVRGFAKNMFIRVRYLDKGLRPLVQKRELLIFKSNLEDFNNGFDYWLVFTKKEKIRIRIKDYSYLTPVQSDFEFYPNCYIKDTMTVNGEKLNKNAYLDDFQEIFENVDNYTNKKTTISAIKEINKYSEIAPITENKVAEDLFEKAKRMSENKEGKRNLTIEEIISSMNMAKFTNEIEIKKPKEESTMLPMHNLDKKKGKSLELIGDYDLIGELNAIHPNLNNLMLNKELYISQRDKSTILFFKKTMKQSSNKITKACGILLELILNNSILANTTSVDFLSNISYFSTRAIELEMDIDNEEMPDSTKSESTTEVGINKEMIYKMFGPKQ